MWPVALLYVQCSYRITKNIQHRCYSQHIPQRKLVSGACEKKGKHCMSCTSDLVFVLHSGHVSDHHVQTENEALIGLVQCHSSEASQRTPPSLWSTWEGYNIGSKLAMTDFRWQKISDPLPWQKSWVLQCTSSSYTNVCWIIGSWT